MNDTAIAKLYQEVRAEGGDWDEIAERSGLEKSYLQQRLGVVKQGLKVRLEKAGKSEDEIKEAIDRVLPPMRQRSSQNTGDAVAALLAEVAELDEE